MNCWSIETVPVATLETAAESFGITCELDALLLFAAAVDYAESGTPFVDRLCVLKSVVLNDLTVSRSLSPETVRLLCCGRYDYIDQSAQSIEGRGAAPRWLRLEGGDITIDNIDTP